MQGSRRNEQICFQSAADLVKHLQQICRMSANCLENVCGTGLQFVQTKECTNQRPFTVNTRNILSICAKKSQITVNYNSKYHFLIKQCNQQNENERTWKSPSNSLQLHADLSVYFRNGHNCWILYPEGSIYSSGLSLRECSF